MASLRFVRPSWYVRYHEDGRERFVRVGPSKEDAESLRLQIEERLKEHGQCSWCETPIVLTGTQKQALRAGHRVYCSRACYQASSTETGTARCTCGPCKTCGVMFAARSKDRKYCSLKCYTSSAELIDRLREQNQSKSTPRCCANCQIQCPRRRKFCTTNCQRSYYAARFDRWIANPQKLALPQNYDEFLMQDELPCLIDGCDWIGSHLSYHCNIVHGITAKQLKELAGFNRRTGLITPAMRDKMRDRNLRLIEEGIINRGNPETGFEPGHPQVNLPLRLEGKEHFDKARAMLAAGPLPPPKPCRVCGSPAKQPLSGVQYYCSTSCRSRYYTRKGIAELNCSHCGQKFSANRQQIIRAERRQKVCCSQQCRNRMNIVAALISRNIAPAEPLR